MAVSPRLSRHPAAPSPSPAGRRNRYRRCGKGRARSNPRFARSRVGARGSRNPCVGFILPWWAFSGGKPERVLQHTQEMPQETAESTTAPQRRLQTVIILLAWFGCSLTLGQERDNVEQWHWRSTVDVNVSFAGSHRGDFLRRMERPTRIELALKPWQG